MNDPGLRRRTIHAHLADARGALTAAVLLALEAFLDAHHRLLARYGARLGWYCEIRPDAVVTRPLADAIRHEDSPDCICGPAIDYADPDTGHAYDVPYIEHHALDGRA